MNNQRAAIYHFTDGLIRNAYCDNEIHRLLDFAKAHGYDKIDTFCDVRTSREEHDAFDQLLARRSEYDAIITKDYFHINKYVLKAKALVDLINMSGVKVVTMCDTPLTFQTEPPINEPLRAVTYYCHWNRHPDDINISLKNDILSCYVDTQTKWDLKAQYYDQEKKGHAGKQEQLQQLIEHRNDYDIIITNSLASLHWRTYNFCRTRKLIGKDIYSLQDGFLQYKE